MNDTVTEEFSDLLFDVRRSVRYHSYRQGFFSRCHYAVMFFSAMLGSATVVAFGSSLLGGLPLWAKLLPSVMITVLVMLDLVIRFTDKAWQHADFKRQFVGLQQELEGIRHAPTREGLHRITTKRLQIEAQEPPIRRILNAKCYNEEVLAMGFGAEKQVALSTAQECLAQFVDWRGSSLRQPGQAA